jgi:esterase/lipase superfamily enzyme
MSPCIQGGMQSYVKADIVYLFLKMFGNDFKDSVTDALQCVHACTHACILVCVLKFVSFDLNAFYGY